MSEYRIDFPQDEVPSGTGDPHIRLASRVLRLPPYMFGRINHLLYEKRRAGHDVIDLGMGNPSDPPEDLVIEKLVETEYQYKWNVAWRSVITKR